MNIEKYQKKKKELNLTYDEIAEKSGISKRTIAGFFSNDEKYANPSITTLQAIERALGLDEWTADERAAGVKETISVPITAIEDEMLTLFRELRKKHGEEAQRAIITVLEKML